jgi:hypothetical protein
VLRRAQEEHRHDGGGHQQERQDEQHAAVPHTGPVVMDQSVREEEEIRNRACDAAVSVSVWLSYTAGGRGSFIPGAWVFPVGFSNVCAIRRRPPGVFPL